MTLPAVITSHFRLWLTLLLVWAGIILWLSLDPSPPVPQDNLLGWDKLQHAGAYALLTLFAGSSWAAVSGSSTRTWILSAVSTVAYGGLLEVLQAVCTRSRSAEAGDLIADAVGAASVVAVVLTIRWSGSGRLAGR